MLTAWMRACDRGDIVTMKQLLNEGQDPDEYGLNQRTAIMFAGVTGNMDMAKLLLAHNADPTITDNRDKTAAVYAEDMGHPVVAEYLRKAERGQVTCHKDTTSDPHKDTISDPRLVGVIFVTSDPRFCADSNRLIGPWMEHLAPSAWGTTAFIGTGRQFPVIIVDGSIPAGPIATFKDIQTSNTVRGIERYIGGSIESCALQFHRTEFADKPVLVIGLFESQQAEVQSAQCVTSPSTKYS